MIAITLPDGSVKQFESETTPMGVAISISEGFARNIISASFNGKTIETSTPIKKDGELVFIPAAVACGLTCNLKENSLRGVMPVDDQGNRSGHPYPVSIDAITEWNGKQIIL